MCGEEPIIKMKAFNFFILIKSLKNKKKKKTKNHLRQSILSSSLSFVSNRLLITSIQDPVYDDEYTEIIVMVDEGS